MKTKKIFALILALVNLCIIGCICADAETETGTNLVTNPLFSNGLEGWTYSDTEHTNPILSVGGVDGEYLKPNRNKYIEQIIPITETGTYKLSFKMKAHVFNAVTLLEAVYRAGAGAYVETYVSDPSKDNYDLYRYGADLTQGHIKTLAFGENCAENEATWKDYELTVPVPSEKITAFRLRLQFGETAPLGVDNIRFEKVNDSVAAVINGGMDHLDTSGQIIGGVSYATSVTREKEESGNYYMKLPDTKSFRQYMAIEPGKTYRLSYRMKSNTKNPLKFYDLSSRFLHFNTNADQNFTGLAWGDMDTTYDGDALGKWKEYNLTFSVPQEGVNTFGLFLQASADCCIDDIAIEEVEQPFNYIFNGDFEGGTAGWNIVTGGTIVEENGNRYYHKPEGGAYIRQSNKMLPAGRYKLSFKAKVKTENDQVGIAIWKDTVPEEEDEWSKDFKDMKRATCTAKFEDDWQQFNFYFTLKTDNPTNYFELPGYANEGTAEAYYDDITLTRDESWIEFADYTQENILYGFAEAKMGETLTRLRDAGDKIPVTAHYIPQKAGDDENAGTAETVYLMAALYETVEGVKKLVGLDIKEGTTDVVSNEAQKGRTAKGIVSLKATVDTPEDLSEAHEMKAFLINSDNLLSPAYKTISIGY